MSITAHHYIITKVTLPTDNANVNARLFSKTIADKIISVCGATALKYINNENEQSFYASLDLGTGEGLAIYKPYGYYTGYIGLIEPEHTEMTTLKRYTICADQYLSGRIYENRFVIFEENGKLLAISFYTYSSYSYSAPLFFYHNEDGSIDMGFCGGVQSTSYYLGSGLIGVVRLGEYKYQGASVRAKQDDIISSYSYFETGKAGKTYCMKTDRSGMIIDRLEYPVYIYNRNSTLPSANNTVFTRIQATEASGDESKYMHIGCGCYFMPYDTWITENISV